MERIIRGIMRYRHTTREQMVKEFVQVKNNPHVSAHNKIVCLEKSNRMTGNFQIFTAKSGIFHMHGQSNDTDTVYRDTCR